MASATKPGKAGKRDPGTNVEQSRTSVLNAPRTTSYAQLIELLSFSTPPSLNVETVRFEHLRLRCGEKAFTVGQQCDSLLLVRSGFLKTVSFVDLCEEKVQSFSMRGDVIGTEGFHSKKHISEAIALSDCELVIVPFHQLQRLTARCPELSMAISALLSRKLFEEQKMHLMLAKIGAEARVARFLVAVSSSYASLGFSKSSFELKMTRQDVASYLGTTMETVSRTLTALEKLGYIEVDYRLITIHVPEALEKLRRIPASTAGTQRFARRTAKASIGASGSTAGL